jgi:hypothetical protein
LSPVKHSREFDPLDPALDSKTQKQAVEMRFDGALGDIQVPRNFRVVTSLEKQVNDLTFPRAHLAEILFHKYCTCTTRPSRHKWPLDQPRGRI